MNDMIGWKVMNESSYADQQKMIEEFDKTYLFKLPNDIEKIIPIFEECCISLQDQSLSDDWRKFYMSPFNDVDARLNYKKNKSISTEKFSIGSIKKFLNLKKIQDIFNKEQATRGANFAFRICGIKFLEWIKSKEIPSSRIKEVYNKISEITGLSHNSKPLYLRKEGYTVSIYRKDADWRGPKPDSSFIRGTMGDSIMCWVEILNDGIKVHPDPNSSDEEKLIKDIEDNL